jgi:uncharacterized membrane protein
MVFLNLNIQKLILSSFILMIIDYFYIKYIAGGLLDFNKTIKNIQGSDLKLNYLGVILCYICLSLVFYGFIIQQDKSVMEAFILGFLIYGIYETTNLATIKNWPLKLLIVDTIWGGVLFGISTYIFRYIETMFIKN